MSLGAVRSGRILLTGSEGAIGSHLKGELRDQGYGVRSLDIRPASDRAADHRRSDLRDPAAMRDAMRGVDAVVHAGGIPWDRDDALAVMSTNELGTWNVLQAAVEAGVPRVVVFSSINAQGSVGGWRATEYLPIDDDYPHHPMTPYQLSKHLMEETCRSFSERHRLVTICLRPVFVVHPASHRPVGYGADAYDKTWRDDLWAYVDVRDVGDAVVRSLRLEDVLHDRFLLAAPDTSVATETRTLVDLEYPAVPWPRVDPGDYFAVERHRSLIDCRHAREVLGWVARHTWRATPSAASDKRSEG